MHVSLIANSNSSGFKKSRKQEDLLKCFSTTENGEISNKDRAQQHEPAIGRVDDSDSNGFTALVNRCKELENTCSSGPKPR